MKRGEKGAGQPRAARWFRAFWRSLQTRKMFGVKGINWSLSVIVLAFQAPLAIGRNDFDVLLLQRCDRASLYFALSAGDVLQVMANISPNEIPS